MDIKDKISKNKNQVKAETVVSEYDQKILHERALALSKPHSDDKTKQDDKLYVVRFNLSGEIYCIEADFVKEVLPLKELTVVPCTPPFVLGVISIRGEIFTVLNLKKVFSLYERGISEFKKVILIQFEETSFGIVADTILDSIYIMRSMINLAPYSVKNTKNEYISGVTSEGLIVLNAEALIKSSELVVNHKQK